MSAEPTLTFYVDGKEKEVGNSVQAIVGYPPGWGRSAVQFTITPEGFIADAFNEDGVCYKTEAFTFEEWSES